MSRRQSVRAAVVAAAVAGLLGIAAAPALAVPAPNKWTEPSELVPISTTTFGGVSIGPFGLVPIGSTGSADFVPISGAPIYASQPFVSLL